MSPLTNWKNRTKPNLNHVTGLFDNDELGAYITGHLILESVLVQLIELKLTDEDNLNPFNLSFPNKIEIAKNRLLIDDDMASFLLEMNRIRNRLAHRLREPITFEVIFNLAKCAAAGGVDFSDEAIHSCERFSRKEYGVRGIIQEIFQNAAQDLAFIMEDHGGKFQLS